MSQTIKYVHTNLIAKDWRKLSLFYINVFGCKPVYPERNLSGEWIDKLTKINHVEVKGIHLQLPGYIENAPTLEIFEYNQKENNPEPMQINDFGFSHIAFHVDNVEEMLEKVIDCGGKKFGELVKTENNIGKLTAIYVTDPEGNIIEIQNWEK